MIKGHATLADVAFLVAVILATLAGIVQLAARRVPVSFVAGMVSLAIAAIALGLLVA